jgi:hypothetical protein
MSSDKSDPEREAKLAQALRANLRRRKAPKPAPPQEDPPPGADRLGGAGGRS